MMGFVRNTWHLWHLLAAKKTGGMVATGLRLEPCPACFVTASWPLSDHRVQRRAILLGAVTKLVLSSGFLALRHPALWPAASDMLTPTVRLWAMKLANITRDPQLTAALLCDEGHDQLGRLRLACPRPRPGSCVADWLPHLEMTSHNQRPEIKLVPRFTQAVALR